MIFTTAGTDMKGRMLYRNSSSQFEWNIVDRFTAKMTLKSAGLDLGAALVSASDKRLKFNDKLLVNALDIINKLEPVEYDQTFNFSIRLEYWGTSFTLKNGIEICRPVCRCNLGSS